MKWFFLLVLGLSFTAHADPFLTVKERLRLHLWVNGLEQTAKTKAPSADKKDLLPEELERPLRKL